MTEFSGENEVGPVEGKKSGAPQPPKERTSPSEQSQSLPHQPVIDWLSTMRDEQQGTVDFQRRELEENPPNTSRNPVVKFFKNYARKEYAQDTERRERERAKLSAAILKVIQGDTSDAEQILEERVRGLEGLNRMSAVVEEPNREVDRKRSERIGEAAECIDLIETMNPAKAAKLRKGLEGHAKRSVGVLNAMDTLSGENSSPKR